MHWQSIIRSRVAGWACQSSDSLHWSTSGRRATPQSSASFTSRRISRLLSARHWTLWWPSLTKSTRVASQVTICALMRIRCSMASRLIRSQVFGYRLTCQTTSGWTLKTALRALPCKQVRVSILSRKTQGSSSAGWWAAQDVKLRRTTRDRTSMYWTISRKQLQIWWLTT